jgi:hypothetical protein
VRAWGIYSWDLPPDARSEFTTEDAQLLLLALEDMQVRVMFYRTESVHKVALQKTIPAQIRQLTFFYHYYKE